MDIKDVSREEEERILLFFDDCCEKFKEQFGRVDPLLEAARNARRLSFDVVFGPPLNPSTDQPTTMHRAPRYGNA